MIVEEMGGGRLVVDPEAAWIHYIKGEIMVEIPIQFVRPDGLIDAGSVYLGTEPVDVAVREAHRWAENRALVAQFGSDSHPMMDK
jgi:hypothetical protein